VTVAWSYFFIRYKKGLMSIQIIIHFLLLISCVYCAWSLVESIFYNINGEFITYTNVILALLNAVELSIIRVVVILVALGYSITKPVLSNKLKTLIIVITICYLAITATSNYVDVLESASIPVDDFTQYAVIFLVTLVNAIYIIWIGFSAYTTVKALKKEEFIEKYTMYRNLSMVLIGAAFCSVIFYIIQFFIELISEDDDAFRVWWIFTLYWEVIYFIIITNVAYIWLPSPNNLKYAYEDIDVEFKDENHDRESNNDISLEESTTKKKEEEERNCRIIKQY